MTSRQTLGEVAVSVVSDASGFDQNLASAIDAQLAAPMLEAADAADELRERWDALPGSVELSESVWVHNRDLIEQTVSELEEAQLAASNASDGFWDLSASATGLRSATIGLPPILGQIVRTLRSPTPIGLLVAAGAGAAALVTSSRRASEEIRRLAASLDDVRTGELAAGSFSAVVDDLNKLFTDEDRRRLDEWGISTRDLALDNRLLADSVDRLADSQERASGVFSPDEVRQQRATRDQIGLVDELTEARRESARRAADEAAFIAAQQDTLAARTEGAIGRVVSEFERLSAEGDQLRSDLTASFAGWVDIVDGVPDQIALSAKEIAANAQDALVASAQLTENWIRATELGAQNVADAILEAGPAANEAFADLLSNPQLLSETESSLSKTFDLAARVAEEQVDRLVTPEMRAGFESELRQLGVFGVAGLVRGIQDAGPSASAAMRAVLGRVLADAKAAWGVQSPSLLFRNEVGWSAMQGIEQGIAIGGPVVSATLRSQLTAVLANARRTVPAPAQGVGKAIAENIVTGFEQAQAVIDRAAAQLARDVTQRQLREVQAEAQRLAGGVTAGETVAIERAERELRRLEASVSGIGDAEAEIAAAQLDAASALAARQAAAEAWDFQAFQAAEAQLAVANRTIEARERWLETARDQVATEAELALAAERLRDAQAAPAERRVTIVEDLRAAEIASLRAGLGLAQAPQIDVRINFNEVVDEARARAVARAVVDEALQRFVDGLAKVQ